LQKIYLILVTAKGQPPEFLIHIAMTAKNMNFKNF